MPQPAKPGCAHNWQFDVPDQDRATYAKYAARVAQDVTVYNTAVEGGADLTDAADTLATDTGGGDTLGLVQDIPFIGCYSLTIRDAARTTQSTFSDAADSDDLTAPGGRADFAAKYLAFRNAINAYAAQFDGVQLTKKLRD
ncbi:hypothetical protein [Tsukamurella soli]|uniref:hypothetical protein n=1 Tax=Tsukamurella soli TaxID=644556 RepID=UPI0031EFC6AB